MIFQGHRREVNTAIDPCGNQYLASSKYIDWKHSEVFKKAKSLKGDLSSDADIAKKCFEYVRDSIPHSWDHQVEIVTCMASDVLIHKTGYCYAKSHLLAALLRANGIPAGLCYQRLSLEGDGAPYCLHGLNAVYLDKFGWYRLDPRGNKAGVDARFTPPVEQLAFTTNGALERDIQGVREEPLSVVVDTLQKYDTCQAVYENLPDLSFEKETNNIS